ncbi:type VI secretion system protein TssA [Luteimonas huabeiensis]|uniref:type VI secretion system protein TssA n=1 Tax=Luteimonas huabeiensis TaxID=1244513 RepID=UPI0004658E8C|nr:type VI secretion system protein TssA [Luteimonas huabeiensis]
MNAAVDIAALAAPLDADAPAGPDLEYDADFMVLERAAAPREERVFGDSVVAAEEPDWDKVALSALALFERTRDLRVAIVLCTAWLRLRGLPGWCDGLALVHALLDGLWGPVHPQLDAEDDDDPTARVNALMPLADPLGALRDLRAAPFVQSPRLGPYSLRDLRIAGGSLKPAGGDGDAPPSLADIEACCLDCPEAHLAASAQAAREALAHARAIDALLAERLSIRAPELKPLLADLYELDRFLQAQWAARSGVAADDAQADGDGAAEDAGGAAAPAARAPGRIAGPADVVERIEELCEYYARQEPSSPVPILLRRAQRLVGRGFEDLLRDLAPGGLGELQQIAGPAPE